MQSSKGERIPGRIIYRELGYRVQGALHAVYFALGPGFREQTYQRAVEHELAERGIPFETEKAIEITYAGETIDQYRLDLVVDGRIILELKAVDNLHPRHEAQVLSYLKASGLRLALLVDFGSDRLQIVRKVM
jgi:GxxExxY protein